MARHKKAEEIALKKVAELQQHLANRGADAWFTGLIHELKQPLTAMVNYTQICTQLVERGQTDSNDLRHAMEQASLQADRAAELVRNARRITMPTAMKPSPIRLGEVIREAVQLLEGELLAGKIQIECDLSETTEIQADPMQIRLVLLNLLRNGIEAIERTSAGPRSIRVAVEPREAEVEVAIRDTGEGLSLQAVHNLFEPFRTTKPQGTGIGLALSRAIIRRTEATSGRNHTPTREQPSFSLYQREHYEQFNQTDRLPRGRRQVDPGFHASFAERRRARRW